MVFIFQFGAPVVTQIIGFTAPSALGYQKICPLTVSNNADISTLKEVRKLITDATQPHGYVENSGRGRPLGQYELARDETPADPQPTTSAA